MKVLFWDGSGIVMIYKRLEQGGFAWPKVGDGVMRLSRVQFEALFAGLDWRRIHAPRPTHPPRQSDSDRLVNMGNPGGTRYKQPCLRPPISPLIWTAFRPPCVRRLRPCRPRSPGWRRRPNVRIT
ncbi:IS66 family insertion sequence element accessory protein TnpB [Gemmobacter fulvus]|uniref:IS66 family insertion sequence element accessory protein TnpB n=1 Tax=Gemmobacter fulvus TaxID=2840474 RepID=UPI0035316FAD